MKEASGLKISVIQNGPYCVEGDVPLAKQHIVTNEEGESLEWRKGQEYSTKPKYMLCRCGQSATKPFCDGAHKRVGFDGTETASREPYERQAVRTEGPTMVLEDAESLCAFARFCDPAGQVWNLVRESGPAAAKLVVQESGNCPSGRLIAKNRASGEAILPQHVPSIGIVEDTAKNVSGPIWVRGGIAVFSADGHPYEVRNQLTLCRCGASNNKPYCDGSHASTGFRDDI